MPTLAALALTVSGTSLKDMATLSEQEIQEKISDLSGWSTDGTAIEKHYEFEDFNAAMKFMATVAPSIDSMNHHPEWSNVYNSVDVRLSSHDEGGVTQRDLDLARVLDGALPQ